LFAVVSVTLKLPPVSADAGGLLIVLMTRSGMAGTISNALLVAPVRPEEDAANV
jgi:hypothetical protein